MERDSEMPPKGLICPLVTPLRQGGRVDERAVEHLITQISPHVDGILLGDMVYGEAMVLDGKTRLDLFSSALEVIAGTLPVFVTITAKTEKDTQEILRQAENLSESLGYTGTIFWFDYPIYYHGNRGLPQWYRSIADGTPFRLVLANRSELIHDRKPFIKHKNIRTHVLKKLSVIEEIQGLVFDGSLKRSINYRRAVGDRRDFRFYDANEQAFMKQPSTDGVVAVGANLFSQGWRSVTDACLNAHEGQTQYGDYRRQILQTAGMLETFRAAYAKHPAALVKGLLHMAGLLPAADLAPGTPVASPGEMRVAEALCRKYDCL